MLFSVLLVIAVLVAVLTTPISMGYKAECDRRGGFYDWKSTACWTNGGYEVLGWR